MLAAALILQRQLRFGRFSSGLIVLYIPRGPLLAWDNPEIRQLVLDDLQKLARETHAIQLKMDPDLTIGTGLPGADDAVEDSNGLSVMADLQKRGWSYSPEQIQFRNTVMLDLDSTEDVWLGRMKQKTRYNLKLSQKKGVTIRQALMADLPLLYKMYMETSIRDGFVIRPESYYLRIWEKFIQAGMGKGLIAEADGMPVAAVILFYFGDRAWYLYGMSRDEQREKMPNYSLQWEAMRTVKQLGFSLYDLWGAPEVFDESDSMWGVFRFKMGLGGRVVRTLGAYDYAPRPWLYRMYTIILPKILDWMRFWGKARTQKEFSQ